MLYDIFDSPLGIITASTDGVHVTGLHIEGDRYFLAVPDDWERSTGHPVLERTRRELGEYLAGERRQFDVPLRLEGTEFQQAVWRALMSVPAGETASYREIAQMIGRPLAVRAVGTAIGRNPICVLVPCHRVLSSNGALGGYVAGLAHKRRLLELEGVIV